ncbi:carboxypeptidase regulatory-like domain-containing protein, partial [bacterium]|nr:carboxypeptidase regulatory-like domain-containing protein [bacterium]
MLSRLLSIAAALLLTPVLLLSAVNHSTQIESSDAVILTVERDDQTATEIVLEVSSLEFQTFEFNGERCVRADIGLEPATVLEGWPELPMITRAVLVPPTAGVRLVVNEINSRIEKDFSPFIVPLQDGTADVDLPGVPTEEYLSYDGFWPPRPITISQPAILRGHRIVQVTIYPVQYNPATGEARFNDRVDFELVYEGEGVNPVLNPDRPRPSRYIRRILEQLVVNPPAPSRDDALSGSYLYIIPEVDDIEEAMEPLLEWRNRQGHKVIVEYVDNRASINVISNIIDAAYDDWDPAVEFVALVGDADGSIALSAFSGNPSSDFGYTQLEGNDYLPDVALGRISVSSMSELNRVVNKLVTYEADPWLDEPEWFLQGAVVAGHIGNGLSTVLVAKYVRKELLNLGFDEVRHWYHTEDHEIGGNQPFVTQSFEWGISIFHYRAYQRMNQLPVNVIQNLPNTDGPWPPFLGISCNTGDFVGQTGHSEYFFRSRGGSVGSIGTSTPGTSPPFNNIMAGGVWKGIYKDKLYAFGWGLNMGRYELWKAYYNLDGRYENFIIWNNLMGDPGTHIWTGLPDAIDVTHKASISLGESRFSVTVQYEDEDTAVIDALVCLYKKDELHLTAFTDEEGVAEFLIPTDALEEGNLMLTVTKHNHEPYLVDVDVIEKEFYIGVSDWSVEDDEDAIPNPGENIELTLFMTNFGTSTPDGPITIVAESLSPWAEVTDEWVEVEDVPEPGESIDILVTVEIDDSAPDEEIVLLAVNTSYDETTWYSVAALEIEAPRLIVGEVEIAEQDFGPGDHSDIYIWIGNAGRKAIAGFSATLFCETDIIRIDNDEARYEGIDPDDSRLAADGMLAITAHPFSIPGMEVEAWLAIESEEGFIDSISFRIPIGEAHITAPFGPDDYGYVCFDSGDEGWEMTPVYDWIEIDPDIDENDFEGENTGLRDGGDNQDQSMVVDLPFEFKYYGEVFNELTICTNGWAAFGNQRELADFRNRRIAQALGPNAQLCVFWDNLVLANDSKILTYYDEEEGQFIIEWSKVHRLHGRVNFGEEETFQIILYDVRLHPTYSGDGIIVFQYKDVTNGATPAHNDTPYATIGISNLDDSDGLEYTYWNRFHPGAKRPLEDELALKFSNATHLITGILSGRITDAFDGFPIPGAQITTSRGFWNVSNENGEYIIEDILIGDGYTVTITAQGYNDSTRSGEDGEGYTIIEDEITTANFALLHPEFNSTQNSFEFLMLPDTTTESGFEVSNNGNGSLVFDSRFVYIFDEDEQTRDEPDEAWEMMLSWNVTDSVANQDQDPDYRIQGVVYA